MARDQRGEPELPPGPARDLVDLYRRLRLNTKLTGGQIAVKAHMSAGHVSDVLRGRKAPGPDTAAKIANALGARMEEIQLARQLAEELAELNQYNRRRARGGQQRSQADGGQSAVQSASTGLSLAWLRRSPSASDRAFSTQVRSGATGCSACPVRRSGLSAR